MAFSSKPKTPKPPPQAVAKTILARYLDPMPPRIKGELIAFGILWRKYPSLAFWTHHELGFPLHSLYWFVNTDEGAEKLATDWAVFNLVLDEPVSHKGLDTVGQPGHNEGSANPDLISTPRRARTVGEFLSQSAP